MELSISPLDPNIINWLRQRFSCQFDSAAAVTSTGPSPTERGGNVSVRPQFFKATSTLMLRSLSLISIQAKRVTFSSAHNLYDNSKHHAGSQDSQVSAEWLPLWYRPGISPFVIYDDQRTTCVDSSVPCRWPVGLVDERALRRGINSVPGFSSQSDLHFLHKSPFSGTGTATSKFVTFSRP